MATTSKHPPLVPPPWVDKVEPHSPSCDEDEVLPSCYSMLLKADLLSGTFVVLRDHEDNYADDDEGETSLMPDVGDKPDADTYDQFVGAEVTLPIGDKLLNAKVRSRKRGSDGSLLGKANQNPILDTRTY
jgi:hypothetical protein